MKTSVNWLSSLFLFLLLAGCFTACKKPGTDPVEPLKTTITSIDPATAPVGSTIAITGTNFSTTPGSNTVLIGGVPATVVSASSTQIVVTVPAGGVTGPVSVSANGQTAQSAASFTTSIRPTVEKQLDIRSNQVWKKDTIYILRGLVYIPDQFTLTIEPGTIIKGAAPAQDPVAGRNAAGTLVIDRGGKIQAVGTATQPIIFTSAKPAGQRSYGDWGGIVMLGKAPYNRPGTTTFAGLVRGTTETYNEPADNSGTLQYARIEFAGIGQPTANSRLNGLTLYGVGHGTTIDHVQVSYSGTDSFAWFGGAVNMKYLVSFRASDDDWSSDWGYTNKIYTPNTILSGEGGKVQFGVALRDPAVADLSGANSFESQNFNPGDNGAGVPLTSQNGLPQTAPIFANISSFAFNGPPSTTPTARGGAYQAGMYLRGNTAISIYNSVFVGFPEGLHIDGAGTLANATANELDLRGVVIANALTPVVGTGSVTNEQATAYFLTTGKSNIVIPTSGVADLLLDPLTYTLTKPSFLPLAGSTLLQGGVTNGKVADKFFTPTTYRGAFNTENWLQGWTNFDPQIVNYDY